MTFKLKNVPTPLASIAFSLTVLGDLWNSYSHLLHNICGLLGFILFLPFALRCFFCPEAMRQELTDDPATAGLFPKLFMTSMQLAAYLAPYFYQAGFYWWWLAVIGHFIFIVWFTYYYIFHLKWQDIFATWYIVYVGIVVAATTAPAFALQNTGLFVFYFGLYGYIATLILISWRYLRHPIEKLAQKPLFCIYTAPMSLCLAGYLKSTADKNALFILCMVIVAQFFFLLVLSQLPRFLRQPFALSYASFTFPFVITALAFTGTVKYFGLGGIWHYFDMFEKLLASGLILYVMAEFARYWRTIFLK